MSADESYEKYLENQKRYWASEAGRKAQNRYFQSDAGKVARDRYFNSEKGKEALLRYYLSEKAETTRQKRQALIKLFRQADKWLRFHPDTTIEDFFTQLQ